MKSHLGKLHDYKVDGVLFDLGVSSHQIDRPERGFTYRFDGDLDMRMNQAAASSEASEGLGQPPPTAYDLVNNLSIEELEDLFYSFGDESRYKIIAKEIVLSRPIRKTLELKEAICRVTPGRDEIKTLSRCFQALRIAVNDELGCLEEALSSVQRIVKPGGRLVVLSYHSLEDRLIKDLFNSHRVRPAEKISRFPSSHSFIPCQEHNEQPAQVWRSLFKKPVVPSNDEVKTNSRSRSAKMRVAERL